MTEGKHTLGSYSFFNDPICKHYHALYNYNALPWFCSYTYDISQQHGLGACEGVGGTVKHLAARASLQRPYNEQITIPQHMNEWAQKDIPAVHFHYCTQEEYNAEMSLGRQVCSL